MGGTGIVIEEVDGELKGRIYPVTSEAQSTFYGKDGETKSVISIVSPDWEAVKVTDLTTGSSVEYETERFAFQFDVRSGHDYRIH